MTIDDTPDGWNDEGRHPEHGVSAYSSAHFVHTDGTEVTVWSDVEAGSARYEITADDHYAVEVHSPDGTFHGKAFKQQEDAEQYAIGVMTDHD